MAVCSPKKTMRARSPELREGAGGVRALGWTDRNQLPENALPVSGIVFVLVHIPEGGFVATAPLLTLLESVRVKEGKLILDQKISQAAVMGVIPASSARKGVPRPAREARLSVVKKLKDYLTTHIRDQRASWQTARAEGYEWRYTPPPSQKFIAQCLGVSESRLSRAISKSGDLELKRLLDITSNEAELLAGIP